MKTSRILRTFKFILVAALFIAVAGFLIMRLWNWLMPELFGLHPIHFWQAIGLLILSKILFGGFRGGPARHFPWRRRMMERWQQMTPEEREKFRHGLQSGCGPFARPDVAPKA